MIDKDYFEREMEAEDIARKIIKRYKGYGTDIEIKEKGIEILQDRYRFKIKMLQGTRIADLHKYAEDIKLALKLQFFDVVQEENQLFIIAAKKIFIDNHLFRILRSHEYRQAQKANKNGILHPIGVDMAGRTIITDLTRYPHMAVCGTTGSGKTEALRSLLASVIFGNSPRKLRLVICDKGGDLHLFADTPHLACPIAQDSQTFARYLRALYQELERRIKLKHSEEYKKLPYILLLADEAIALITGIEDKAEAKQAATALEELLRRGRHGKIHVVLAAHNPTQKKMQIDISDLPTKMVFRMAKYNNSVTALGVSGAEKLSGRGDMLFQSSQHDQIIRLQGAFIPENDIIGLLFEIKRKYSSRTPEEEQRDQFFERTYGFTISEKEESAYDIPDCTAKPTQDTEDKIFAKIVVWALGQESVSGNLICETFRVGWRKAKNSIDRLHSFGIVGEKDAKLPRAVLPVELSDLSSEIVDFLKKRGYTEIYIREVLAAKDDSN